MSNSSNTVKPSACFEVEKVIEVSTNNGKCKAYKVQWAPSWISAAYLMGCEDLIQQFEHEQNTRNEQFRCEQNTRDEQLECEQYTRDEQLGCEENTSNEENTEDNEQSEHEQDIRETVIKVEDFDQDILQDEDTVVYHHTYNQHQINKDHSEDKSTSSVDNGEFEYGNNNNQSCVSKEGIGVRFHSHERVNKEGLQGESVSIYESNNLNNEHTNSDSDISIEEALQASEVSSDEQTLSRQCVTPTRTKVSNDIHQNQSKGLYRLSFQSDGLINKYSDTDRGDSGRSTLVVSKTTNQFGKSGSAMNSFDCNICSEKFTSPVGLEWHCKTHDAYRCSTCYSKFPSEAELQKHEFIHRKGGNHCNICKMTFSDYRKVQEHIVLSHKKGSKYICSICGKLFLTSSKLNIHNRSHTGERPFECDICQQTFIQKIHLRKHLLQKHDKTD